MRKTLKIANVDNSHFEQQCQAYISLLSYWNSIINIVSTRGVDNLLTDLVSQSLKPLEHLALPQRARILDVGSGAGFPALPLKLARPDLNVTLLEPQRKKWLFLRRVIEELNLEGIEAIRAHLEEASQREDWRAGFDLITTRGVGSTLELFGKMEPLIRPGGSCWFYKGKNARQEAEELAEITRHNVQVIKLESHLALVVVQIGEREIS
jgi:16S rRNA (guanine527-N7)-methyltransferase